MSSIRGWEDTIPVPPMKKAQIAQVAQAVLSVVCPKALEEPTALDVLHLIEYELPKLGVHFVPGNPVKMLGTHAYTDPEGTKDIDVPMSEALWDDLIAGGRRANFARSTAMHELGHCILHVPAIRRRIATPASQHLLHRVQRGTIATIEDAEWQAHTFSGFVLMPPRTMAMVQGPTVAQLARIYEVSEAFVNSHLKRLNWKVPMR